MKKFAINGAFGRIGVNLITAFALKGKLERLGLLNDLTSAEDGAFLIKNETPLRHQHLFEEVRVDGRHLVINGHRILCTQHSAPSRLPYAGGKVGVVLEATGRHKDAKSCAVYVGKGCRVVISAPSKDSTVQKIIMGVNHRDYDPDRFMVTSNTSCTSNDVAMLLQTALEAELGMTAGLVLAPHAATVSQRVLAAGAENGALEDMVPAATGAASMLGEVFTQFDGHLDGQALRIGMRDGSVGYLTFVSEEDVTIDQIHDAFRRASEGTLSGRLNYGDPRTTVRHILGSPASATYFPSCTKLVPIPGGGTLVCVAGGYDNEFGYANRMVEHGEMVMEQVA